MNRNTKVANQCFQFKAVTYVTELCPQKSVLSCSLLTLCFKMLFYN